MNRTIAFLLPVILISGAALTLLALALPHLAHAADPSSPPVIAGADPTAVAAWIGAITGGLALILTVAFQILKVVAPRTKTPIDDEWRDAIGEILSLLKGAAPVSTTVVVAPPAPPASPPPSSSTSGTIGMLAVLLVGAGLALQPGCATTRARGSAAAGALLDCQASNLLAAVAELVPLAKQAVMLAIGGTGHVDFAQLRAAAAPLKSDLGRCALAAAIAALANPRPEQPGAPAAAPLEVDGPELRAAFAAIRGELGWPAVRVAEGTVL